jgi:hypothetical protein
VGEKTSPGGVIIATLKRAGEISQARRFTNHLGNLVHLRIMKELANKLLFTQKGQLKFYYSFFWNKLDSAVEIR